MNLPLTRARRPVVTGIVATLRSLMSTGQTPRCPPADRRLGSGRKPTPHVKPRETRCNPGSLSALDEPLRIVILSSTVSIAGPNLNGEYPPWVSTGMLRDVRAASKSLNYDAYLQNRGADACCAASFRRPGYLLTRGS